MERKVLASVAAFQAPVFPSLHSLRSNADTLGRIKPKRFTCRNVVMRQPGMRGGGFGRPYRSQFARPNRRSSGRQSSDKEEPPLPAAVEQDNGDGRGSDGVDGNDGRDGDDGGDDDQENPQDDSDNKPSAVTQASADVPETETVRAMSTEASASTSTEAALERVLRMPFVGPLAAVWPALRNRLAANERLPLQMGVEVLVGSVTKTLAELHGRGERFWSEFDLYTLDMALEIFGDVMLVWLLCPVLRVGATQAGGLASKLLGNLPKHAGQVGNFGPVQRAGVLAYKGIQFGLVGFLSSLAGHGLTRSLVKIRESQASYAGGGERRDDAGAKLGPVLPTSLAWGSYLATSSNVRYQMVNGFEQRLLEPLCRSSAPMFTALAFVLRFGNCYVGGLHWLPWARMWGLDLGGQ